MQDKLQELTDKLYREGLTKGKEEGERILSLAREEAESIVAAAKAEARATLDEAAHAAEDLKSKAASDIRMASAQALQATKKDIENLIVSRLGDAGVEKALSDGAFVREIIKAVAVNFSGGEAEELRMVLPASLRDELEPWVNRELPAILGGGIKAEFSKKLSGGFTIGPGDGSYFISFTDETFRELMAEYLRPVTRKILFGE